MPHRTILMVADEAEQRDLFTFVLERDGWHVDAVASAERALERLSVHAYAVLLTDYELPGMNGPELIGRVRHQWPATCIVLMSTHSDLLALARPLSVDGCFAKMDIGSLSRILEEALSRHAA